MFVLVVCTPEYSPGKNCDLEKEFVHGAIFCSPVRSADEHEVIRVVGYFITCLSSKSIYVCIHH
jgi:hypothetical protein